MGDDGLIAVALGQLDAVQGFGEGADLVGLDQDGVAGSIVDPLAQALHVGDEQVVPHQLHPAAQTLGQGRPALPVLLPQGVFDGEDGVLVHQVFPVFDHILRGELLPPLGQAVPVPLHPLAAGGVQGQLYLAPIACLFNGGQHRLNGSFIAGKVRSKTALVPHAGRQALGLQLGAQGVGDFRAPAQPLPKTGGFHRDDHKLLDVDIVPCVGAAVEDVHHGPGQLVGAGPTQVAE